MKPYFVIVSHWFEPFKYIGSKRATYLTRFLSQRDYNVIVVKAHNQYYGNDVETNCLNNDNFLTIDVTIKKRNYKSTSQTDREWYSEYKSKINDIIGQYDVRCLYFSGEPFFYFLLGPYFKKKYGTHYMLDFRDPWFQDKRLKYEKLKKTFFLNKLDRKLKLFLLHRQEFRAVKDAAYIINVTKRRTNVYKEYYSTVDNSRFITIQNGFNNVLLDETIMKKSGKKRDNKRYHIGIFGKFSYYNKKDVDLLVDGIKKTVPQIDVQIHHYGKTEDYFKLSAIENGLEDKIRFHGFIDYQKGMMELSRMDCLILNHRDNRSDGTKIFDYIYLNKPIIAFTQKDSAIGDLLNNFKNGFIVEKTEDFNKSIEILWKNQIDTLDNDVNVEKYSRASAMLELERYIKSLF